MKWTRKLSNTLTKIKPAIPAAPYLGGKFRLAKLIAKRISATPHTTYAEPFVGMGGVFLRRHEKARSEVINDINRELTTFYRIIQRHYPQFMDALKFQITSRAEFERLCDSAPNTLTDLERAGRVLYMQRTAFGGKVSGRNFGVSADRSGRFDVNKLGPMLEDLHERMAGVVIECLPYQEFIARYDKPKTLFYLDPTYYGCERDYGAGFEREDFEKLAMQLSKIKGRFILSLNDRPEVRKIFAGFDIAPVKTNYSIGRHGNARAKTIGELLISN